MSNMKLIENIKRLIRVVKQIIYSAKAEMFDQRHEGEKDHSE